VPAGLTNPTAYKKMLQRRTIACLFHVAASLEIGLWATKSIAQPAFAVESQGSPKNVPEPELKPNSIFKEIAPLLRLKTRVPIRLPEYVPYSGDKETPLHGILEVAEPDAYSI
jgi:hypothetical protein